MILGQCKNKGEFCGNEPYPPFKDNGKCCVGTICLGIGRPGELKTRKCEHETGIIFEQCVSKCNAYSWLIKYT